jgi:gliding motility associated protien GldN
MNKKIITGVFALIICGMAYGQSFKDIYEKSIADNAKVIYPHLREADVVWSKKIWRIIDLREKMNQSLYYPTKPMADGRSNLMGILLAEIKAGNLSAFDIADMNVNVTYADIEKVLEAGPKEVPQLDLDGNVIGNTTIDIPIEDKLINIKQFMVYEEWFFDKKHSTLGVRIIGLMPISIAMNDQTNRLGKTRLFWIRYEDFRDAFAKHEVFNQFNDAQRMSFDDLFMQRRFSSTIVAESNVFDDRFILEYMVGKDVIFEAERIKTMLQNFEHDLWEY